MSKCRNCLLPEAVPDAHLNGEGVCQKCCDSAELHIQQSESARQRYLRDLEDTLETCRGVGKYDCLVNLSGGKDSCYLLYKAKVEYGLNVLAFTMDINIPDIAWKNIRKTIDKLDVPHLVYRPPHEFYRKMFRYLLQNQEQRGAVRTVCYVCAPICEGYSLKVALQEDIPVVLAGYSPGQPEPDRMTYEFSREMIYQQDWTPQELRDSELFSESELEVFWNPHRYPIGTSFPRFIAPFHAWPYSQEEVMQRVVQLGLIRSKRNASPIHSNCPVNWLLMFSDLKNLGYNPYAPEFSKLIREGKANRKYWRIMAPIVDFMIRKKIFLGKNVRRSQDWLDLQDDQLRITRPAVAALGQTVPGQTNASPEEEVSSCASARG